MKTAMRDLKDRKSCEETCDPNQTDASDGLMGYRLFSERRITDPQLWLVHYAVNKSSVMTMVAA
jgi:hypothetical protein